MTRDRIVFAAAIICFFLADTTAGPVARLGIQGGLAAVELTGPTAGYGMHAGIGFAIKHYGLVDYYPSVDFWMKSKDDAAYTEYRRMEIGLNLLQVRYFPPIPEHIIARPYIGLGGIGVVGIAKYERLDGYTSTDPAMDWGFDFCGGCDFILKQRLRAFIEMRGKSAGYSAFKLYAGLSFLPG